MIRIIYWIMTLLCWYLLIAVYGSINLLIAEVVNKIVVLNFKSTTTMGWPRFERNVMLIIYSNVFIIM